MPSACRRAALPGGSSLAATLSRSHLTSLASALPGETTSPPLPYAGNWQLTAGCYSQPLPICQWGPLAHSTTHARTHAHTHARMHTPTRQRLAGSAGAAPLTPCLPASGSHWRAAAAQPARNPRQPTSLALVAAPKAAKAVPPATSIVCVCSNEQQQRCSTGMSLWNPYQPWQSVAATGVCTGECGHCHEP